MEKDFESLDIPSQNDLVAGLGNFVAHGQKFDEVLTETRIWAESDKFIFPKLVRADASAMSKEIENSACNKWISDAGLHFVNASIPKSLPKSIRTKTEMLQTKCFRWMYPKSNRPVLRRKELDWAISEAEQILQLIDEHHESSSIGNED